MRLKRLFTIVLLLVSSGLFPGDGYGYHIELNKVLFGKLFSLLTICQRSTQAGPDYIPLKKQMEEFIISREATFSIYFQDLSSGKVFGFREDEPMAAASTVKLPMALYLNMLAVKGKLDWKTRVTYQKTTDYEGGNGILHSTACAGDHYSLRTLNTLMLTLSDNIAFRMLARHLGRDNFIRFMKDIGGKTVYPDDKNLTTAKDMGIYLQATLDFVRQHPEEGKRLLDDLTHSIYHTGLPGYLPDNIAVAHKEGDLDEGVANDVGVVFCSRPYLLVVLSSNVKDLDEGFQDIARISKMAYDFQEKHSHPKKR
jgi:beta-lactamase class A